MFAKKFLHIKQRVPTTVPPEVDGGEAGSVTQNPGVFYNNLQQFTTVWDSSRQKPGWEIENLGRSEKCHENNKISNIVCKPFQY